MSLDHLMEELRKEYIETFPEKIEKLQTALLEQNVASIELEFHKMKGTGKTYGFEEITLLGQHMEWICQNVPEKLTQLLPLALTLLEEFCVQATDGHPVHFDGHPAYQSIVSATST